MAEDMEADMPLTLVNTEDNIRVTPANGMKGLKDNPRRTIPLLAGIPAEGRTNFRPLARTPAKSLRTGLNSKLTLRVQSKFHRRGATFNFVIRVALTPLKIGGFALYTHPSCILPIRGEERIGGTFPLDGERLDTGESV